jgi:hypothetical protein
MNLQTSSTARRKVTVVTGFRLCQTCYILYPSPVCWRCKTAGVCPVLRNSSLVFSHDRNCGYAVRLQSGYGLHAQGVRVRVPIREYHLLSLSFEAQPSGGAKMPTHFQLVPRSRKGVSIHPQGQLHKLTTLKKDSHKGGRHFLVRNAGFITASGSAILRTRAVLCAGSQHKLWPGDAIRAPHPVTRTC